MSLITKSFLMSNSQDAPNSDTKPTITPARSELRRFERESLERRSYPDPGNNLDLEDFKVDLMFDSPELISKWIVRAWGNNETSAKMYR